MTYIYKQINEHDFLSAFDSMGRGEQFSYEAKKALFEYYENLAEETDTPIELDVVAICCDWTEYKDIKEVQENYTDIESLEDLREHTEVIEVTKTKYTENGHILINSVSLLVQNY